MVGTAESFPLIPPGFAGIGRLSEKRRYTLRTQFLQMFSSAWTKKDEAAETGSPQATRHNENGNNLHKALGTPPQNQRHAFLNRLIGKNRVTPDVRQKQETNKQVADAVRQLQQQGRANEFVKRHEKLLQQANSTNPARFKESSQAAMRKLAGEYGLTSQVAGRVVGILKRAAANSHTGTGYLAHTPPLPPASVVYRKPLPEAPPPGELSTPQKEILRDIYEQMCREHPGVMAPEMSRVRFDEIYPDAPAEAVEQELLRIGEEAMASTPSAGNPVPPRSLTSLSGDQVQQLTTMYERALGTCKDPGKAAEATYANFKLEHPTANGKKVEEAIWQICIESNASAPPVPPPADMPLPEGEKEQILRDIYSDLLATSGDVERARQQATVNFMEMFPDVQGNEDYLVRVLLNEALQPVENPAGNGERWTRLFNNCAEKAVAELAKRSGREVPQFNYAADPDEPIWDEQIQFGNYVSYLNLQKDIPIHQHQIDNPPLERVLEGGLAQDLLDKLEEGGQEKVYVMRSGFNGGAGHFQLTYFDNERNRWVVDRPKPYAPLDVTDDNGELSQECRSRFIDRNQRYALYLDELDPEKIEQYAQFIVRCRDLKDEFVL